MNSILQNVLNIIVPFTALRNVSIDKRNVPTIASMSSNVQTVGTASVSYNEDIEKLDAMRDIQTGNLTQEALSYQEDTVSFRKLMMLHIQNGTLTQEALDNAIEEHKNDIDADNERKRKAVINEIDREIKNTEESLPESQRKRFKDNIDRQERIDSKLELILDDFNLYTNSRQLSPLTEIIANIVKDPELDKLASSIRIKEKSTNTVYIPTLSMDAYAGNPLSEPLITLRAQHAARKDRPTWYKHPLIALRAQRDAQRSDTPQAFVTEMIRDKKEYVTSLNINSQWSNNRALNTASKDDAYVLEALKKMSLSNKETSEIICNSFFEIGVPASELGKFSSYLRQLTPEDLTRIRNQYVQEFAKCYVIEERLSNKDLFSPPKTFSRVLNEIEFLLHNIMPSGTPDANSYGSWHFKPAPLDTKITIDRIADVLLQVYDVSTVAPILEAYQGNRALDGELSSKDLMSDMRAYLTERTTKTPTTPEVKSDLQLS